MWLHTFVSTLMVTNSVKCRLLLMSPSCTGISLEYQRHYKIKLVQILVTVHYIHNMLAISQPKPWQKVAAIDKSVESTVQKLKYVAGFSAVKVFVRQQITMR